MTKIIVCGCNGRMGKVVVNTARSTGICEVVGGIDTCESSEFDFPVFSSPEKVDIDADVIVDFSNPCVLTSLISYSLKELVPLVLCTTGYLGTQVDEIKEAAANIPVFSSRNMSIGVNLLVELSKRAAFVLGQDFDAEIVEKHHNQKIDAPSGTAFMIAEAVSEGLGTSPRYTYDRHSYRKPREKNEIGIHSIRAGNIVGEHEVIFAGTSEVLSLSHHAQSKEVFAIGALKAANFIKGKSPGIYDMGDLLS